MAQVRNMVFMTEKYVFINSEVPVDEEIGEKIKKLPKAFLQNVQRLCEFVTEFNYDEHKKKAILVCRFKNENDFSETTRMYIIACVINKIHELIAKSLSFNFEEEMRKANNKIVELVIAKNEDNEN